MTEALKYRTFSETWAPAKLWMEVNDFVRDVVQRLNAKLATDQIADDAVTIAKRSPVPTMRLSTATSQSIATGTVTTIAFAQNDYATGLAGEVPTWAQNTNEIVIATDGLYRLTGRAGSALTTAFAAGATRWGTILVVNGANVCQPSAYALANAPVTLIATTTLPLVAGDRVRLAVFQTTTVSQPTLVSSSDKPELIVEYVGAT